MKRSALLMLAACVATACGTVPDDDSTGAAGDMREVAFDCGEAQPVVVRFDTVGERAFMLRNGEEIELRQQRSASGFIYSNGPNTIRGKGDALTVEIGRMVPIQCKAA